MEFILSVSNNFVIGEDGDLAIRNEEDMNFFKQVTSTKCSNLSGNNIVIMGSNTFFSIKKVLKNRDIIVITKKTVDEFKKECEEKEIDMSAVFGINEINMDEVKLSYSGVPSSYINLLNLDNFFNFYRLLLYIEMKRPESRIFCIGGSDIYEQMLKHDAFTGGYINRFKTNYPIHASTKVITDPCTGKFAEYTSRVSDQFTRYIYFDSISVLNALSFATKHIKKYIKDNDLGQCKKDIDFILGGGYKNRDLLLNFYKIMYILRRISDSRSRKNDIDCYEQIMYSMIEDYNPCSYIHALVEDFIDVKDELHDFLAVVTKYVWNHKNI